MTDVADDRLDAGICDGVDAARLEATSDDEALALVLFADIDWTDAAAVDVRRLEWAVLAP